MTAKVLHDSECPVWTGADLEESPAREFAIRSVLCAIDLGPHSPRTLQWGAQMAAEFGARLTLVHITSGSETHGQPPGGSATERIAKLQQESGTKAEVLIDSGDVHKMLSRIAKQVEGDLLVIGRLSGGRLRATGYGTIRESHIPVLSV